MQAPMLKHAVLLTFLALSSLFFLACNCPCSSGSCANKAKTEADKEEVVGGEAPANCVLPSSDAPADAPQGCSVPKNAVK